VENENKKSDPSPKGKNTISLLAVDFFDLSKEVGINGEIMEKGNINLLLVDDYNLNMTPMKVNLKHMGYSHQNIETAVNGPQAIEKARIQVPDLIFMDTDNYSIRGYDACRAIKSEEYRRNITLIDMSNDT
jgi:CheY-like chemotaxis protein